MRDDGGTCSEPIPEDLQRYSELWAIAEEAHQQMVEALALAWVFAEARRQCRPLMPPILDLVCTDDGPDEGVCRG